MSDKQTVTTPVEPYDMSKNEVIAEAQIIFAGYDEPMFETGAIGLLHRAVELLKASHVQN